MELGRLTSNSITHTDLYKLNNKLVSAQLEHFGARMNYGQTRTHKTHHSPDFGGSHHLPPYNILCAQPWDRHPNVILSQDSQMDVLKFPKLGFLQLWGPITLCEDFESFPTLCGTQPTRKEIGAILDFQWLGALLLAITCVLNVQMGHAIPFQTSTFQELTNDMRNSSTQIGFDPYNHSLKIQKSMKTPIPKVGTHLGV